MLGDWLLMTALLYGLPIVALAAVIGYVAAISDRKHLWTLVWLGLISHACVGVLTYAIVTDMM